jgi:hypothetical protein
MPAGNPKSDSDSAKGNGGFWNAKERKGHLFYAV